MTIDPVAEELRTQVQRRARRRRRALAVGGLGLSFFGTAGFWLASSGVFSFSVAPPAGTPSSGNFADVTPLAATVNSGNGGATLQTGIAISEITMSDSSMAKARVDISWTDVSDAAKVLKNPNAQIVVGLYHADHSGSCTTNAPGNTVPAFVDYTDGAQPLCLALDTTATGLPVSGGQLFLAHNQVSGYLLPSLVPSANVSCAAAPTTESATQWCQPASVTNTSSQALWAIASITVPGNGNSPQGQQGQLTSLSFYVGARAS